MTYEGQAAIELEQAIEPDDGRYEGELLKEKGVWILDPLPMISRVIGHVRQNVSPGIISARFHNGLVSLLAEAVHRASTETGIRHIALSGGVFQNAYLLERLEPELAGRGLEVCCHIEVPTNDACIALGQAYIGAQWLMARKETAL